MRKMKSVAHDIGWTDNDVIGIFTKEIDCIEFVSATAPLSCMVRQWLNDEANE